MSAAAAFVILWAFIRLLLWVVITIFRIIAFLLFAPLFITRRNRRPQMRVVRTRTEQPRARRFGNEGALYDFLDRNVRGRRVVEEEEYYVQPRRRQAQRATTAKPVPEPERIPTRNELDLERALTQMGWHKTRSKQIAEQVVRELGPEAELNALVKRGLQLGGQS